MVSVAQLIGRFRPKQAKDLLRRGLKVQARARVLLGGAAGHPRRIDTGQTRSSVQVRLVSSVGHPAVRVGSGLKRALWIHEGTGIYGPRHRKITAKSGGVLVFSVKSGGAKRGKFRGKVVVRSVRGMKPNHFLRDALPAARD